MSTRRKRKRVNSRGLSCVEAAAELARTAANADERRVLQELQQNGTRVFNLRAGPGCGKTYWAIKLLRQVRLALTTVSGLYLLFPVATATFRFCLTVCNIVTSENRFAKAYAVLAALASALK